MKRNEQDFLSVSVFGEPELKSRVKDKNENLRKVLDLLLSMLLPVILSWGCVHIVLSVLGLAVSELEFIVSLLIFSVLLYLMLQSPKGMIPLIIFMGIYLVLAVIFRHGIKQEILALLEAVKGTETETPGRVTHLIMLYGFLNVFFGMAVPVKKMPAGYLFYVLLLPLMVFMTVQQGPSLISVVVTMFSLLSLFLTGRALRTMEAMDEKTPYQAKVTLQLFLLAGILSLVLALTVNYGVYQPNKETFDRISEKVDKDFLQNLFSFLPGHPEEESTASSEEEQITSTEETSISVRPGEDEIRGETTSREETRETTRVPTSSEPTKESSKDASGKSSDSASSGTKDGKSTEETETPASMTQESTEDPGNNTKYKRQFSWLWLLIPLILSAVIIGIVLKKHGPQRKPYEKLKKKTPRETYVAIYEEIRRTARKQGKRYNVDDMPEKLMALFPDLDEAMIIRFQTEAKEARYSLHDFTEEQAAWVYGLYESQIFGQKEKEK